MQRQKDETTGPEFMNTTQAAMALGITPRGVRWLCKKGKIEAKRVGRDWIISTEEINRRKDGAS